MQYISSFIIAWAPFLADPDFQIIIIAAMTVQLLYKFVKKSLKIFATTIKLTITAAIIGLVLYLMIEQPKTPESSSLGHKVSAALYQLKSEFPTFLAEVKNNLEKEPKG